MKKLIVCLFMIFLVASPLFSYVPIEEEAVVAMNIPSMNFQDFVENEVGIGNLTYNEAKFLYDAGIFQCSGNGGSTPLPFFGSWICNGSYEAVLGGELHEGILGMEEICGDDEGVWVPPRVDDLEVEDLFGLEFETIYVWNPYLGYYVPKKVSSAVTHSDDGDKLRSFNENLYSIFEKGGFDFWSDDPHCIYNF